MADTHGGGARSRRPLGLWKNAAKRRDKFVQLFMMTGVLMMSLRSLSQKHRARDLGIDIDGLRGERDHLSSRMLGLQDALHREAEADASGNLASHIRRIFASHPATHLADDDGDH